jgi:hypothetical protein
MICKTKKEKAKIKATSEAMKRIDIATKNILLNLPGAGDETSKILAELEKEIEEIESE